MVTKKAPESAADNLKLKKRKITDPPVRTLPPLEQTVVGSAQPTTDKKEPSVTTGKATAPVKDAKFDSSFFSALKPKPKLPSFNKAPQARVDTAD
ncbi:hypothetical protein K438DRAFT_1953001 [Mycena galopus ATCC 62051]|nr:hypothetical protein K438DRAFT_1953001 [Mycena galopus ATCC 62051]